MKLPRIRRGKGKSMCASCATFGYMKFYKSGKWFEVYTQRGTSFHVCHICLDGALEELTR